MTWWAPGPAFHAGHQAPSFMLGPRPCPLSSMLCPQPPCWTPSPTPHPLCWAPRPYPLCWAPVMSPSLDTGSTLFKYLVAIVFVHSERSTTQVIYMPTCWCCGRFLEWSWLWSSDPPTRAHPRWTELPRSCKFYSLPARLCEIKECNYSLKMCALCKCYQSFTLPATLIIGRWGATMELQESEHGNSLFSATDICVEMLHSVCLFNQL